jgi:hypothetical protein
MGEGQPGVPRRYEIVIQGELSDRFASAFDDVALRRAGGDTVLAANLDQPALHALLERVQDLGLDVHSVRPAPPDS